MTPPTRLPRLALARPARHPLAETVREAGWEPVPHLFTRLEPTGCPPPLPPGSARAILILSPSGARTAGPALPSGTTCLVQGPGTAEALGRSDLEVRWPETARAEALWELLEARFPEGGDVLLVRGERSREHLEAAATGSPFRLHPWVTHREALCEPSSALPSVDGVLALSPFQAEALAPVAGKVLRFAWGAATAEAFAAAGAPAHGHCDPKADRLKDLLSRHVPLEESPC